MPIILTFVMGFLYPKLNMTFDFLYLISGMLYLMALIYYSWIFAILVHFSKHRNKNLPKTSIAAYVYVILILFYYFFVILVDYRAFMSNSFHMDVFNILNVLQVAIHFYLIYSAAKAMRIVELKRPVRFTELIADIISILVFPIGLWVYQPRVRDLINNKQTELPPVNLSST
jgi:hypothetical protein